MKYLNKQTNELMHEQGNKYTETTTIQTPNKVKLQGK